MAVLHGSFASHHHVFRQPLDLEPSPQVTPQTRSDITNEASSTMNWTEGALARHSRRKGWNEEASRQKQYFAKARARLCLNQAQSPKAVSTFIPSYIPQRQDLDPQTPDVRPDDQRARDPRKRLLHVLDSAQRPACEETQPTLNQEFISDQRNSVPGNIMSQQPAFSTDFDGKRRKLLEKMDWAGLECQKPLAVDFSWRNDKGVGTTSLHMAHNLSKSHIVRRSPSNHFRRGASFRHARSPQSMRIRIGTQDFRWSEQSNSVRSPVCASHSASQKDSNPGPDSSNHSQFLGAADYHSLHVTDRTFAGVGEPHRHKRKRARAECDAADDECDNRPQRIPQLHDEVEGTQFVSLSTPSIIHQPQPRRGGWERLLLRTSSPEADAPDSLYAQPDSSVRTHGSLKEGSGRWREWLDSNGGTDSQDQSLTPSPNTALPNSNEWGNDQCLAAAETPSSLLAISPEDVVNKCSRTSNDPPLHCMRRKRSSTERNVTCMASLVPKDLGLLEVISPRPTAEAVPVSSLLGGNSGPMHGEATGVPCAHGLAQQSTAQTLQAETSDVTMDHTESEPQVGPEPGTDADEDEIWRRFIVDDDSSEINHRARAAAQEQTQRELHAQTEPWASDIAQAPSSVEHEIVTCIEDYAEGGGSLPSPTCDSPAQTTTSIAVNPASSADATDSLVAQQGSPPPMRVKHKADFKFHQPQLFVGRLASTASHPPLPTEPPPPPLPRQAATKDGRGQRSRSRRRSGRPDFRAMPDLVGDPIEDCC